MTRKHHMHVHTFTHPTPSVHATPTHPSYPHPSYPSSYTHLSYPPHTHTLQTLLTPSHPLTSSTPTHTHTSHTHWTPSLAHLQVLSALSLTPHPLSSFLLMPEGEELWEELLGSCSTLAPTPFSPGTIKPTTQQGETGDIPTAIPTLR